LIEIVDSPHPADHYCEDRKMLSLAEHKVFDAVEQRPESNADIANNVDVYLDNSALSKG
jgi:hypothetical protein